MEKVICNQMCKLQETIAPKALNKQGTQDSDEVRLHELTQVSEWVGILYMEWGQ